MQNALTDRGGVWGGALCPSPAYKMHNDYLEAAWNRSTNFTLRSINNVA